MNDEEKMAYVEGKGPISFMPPSTVLVASDERANIFCIVRLKSRDHSKMFDFRSTSRKTLKY